MSKRRIRWLVLAAIALLLVLGAYLREGPRGLTVQNRSGEPVALLEITASGHTSTFRDVPDGGQVTAPLGSEGGNLDVQGRLRDGTRIKGRFADAPGGPDLRRGGLVILPGGAIVPRKAGK
jgi:hypothetical protein